MKKWIAYALAFFLLLGSAADGLMLFTAHAEEGQEAVGEVIEEQQPTPEPEPVVPAPEPEPAPIPEVVPESTPEVTPEAVPEPAPDFQQPSTPIADDAEKEAEEEAPEEDDSPVCNGCEGDAYIVWDNGHRHYGTIRALYVENRTVVLCRKIIPTTLEKDTLEKISFALDTDIFDSDPEDYQVYYSIYADADRTTRDGTLYIWVCADGETPPAKRQVQELPEDAADDSSVEYDFQVNSHQTEGDAFPTFTLTTFPERAEGMYFAYSFNDGALTRLEDSAHTPDAHGVYRYYLLAEDGAQVGKSNAIELLPPDESGSEQPGEADDDITAPSDDPEDEESPDDTEASDDSLSYDIHVETSHYLEDQPCAPVFTLSCSPELEDGLYCIVIFNESQYAALSTRTFTPTESGEYRFAILDEAHEVYGMSRAFKVQYAAPEEEKEEPAVVEYELQVTADDFFPGLPCTPTFTLKTIPGLYGNMFYAVSIDGGNLTSLSGSTYTPESSGAYRFFLLDGDEVELAQSGSYEVIYGTATVEDAEMPIVIDSTGAHIQQEAVFDEMDDAEVSMDMGIADVVTNEAGVTATTYVSLADSVTVYTSPEVVAEDEQPILHVSPPKGYTQGGSYDEALTFVLSGIPKGSGDYVYVVDDGDGFSQLVGDTYTASAIGTHKLIFGILDLRTNTIVGE